MLQPSYPVLAAVGGRGGRRWVERTVFLSEIGFCIGDVVSGQ